MAESAQLVNDGDVGGGGSYSQESKSSQEKPEGVPDKFWNSEKGEVDTVSLLASYSELEGKLGTPQEETPELKEAPTSNEDSFNLGKYEDEWQSNNNQLKENTYTELQSKFGLDKTEVDKYIAFRQADTQEFNQEIFGMAGGEESYRSLLGWASNNLSEEEIVQTNKLLETADKDQVRVGVMKLINKHRESVGAEPQRSLSGNTSNQTTGPKPFASLQEAVEARKDKRFDTDPAYRGQWEQRVGASPFVSSS